MDFLYLLAADAPAAVSEGILKYVAGGMGVAILGLAGALWKMYGDVKAIPDKVKEAENVIRTKFEKVISDKDKTHKEELGKKDDEIKTLREDKNNLIQEQMNDLKEDRDGFVELSERIETAINDNLAPQIEANNEHLAKTTDFFRWYWKQNKGKAKS